MCGAYDAFYYESGIPKGSPPRVRGIRVQGATASPDTRITPACAGHTSVSPLIIDSARDHPHVCGAYEWRAVVDTQGCGSPPRVRGILEAPYFSAIESGITPACAGHTVLYCEV